MFKYVLIQLLKKSFNTLFKTFNSWKNVNIKYVESETTIQMF